METSWSTCQVYREYNNIFGCKQHTHPIYGTVNIPTREFINEEWVTVVAAWVNYPTLADGFNDRMSILRTLAQTYLHYAAGLAARTGEEFVTQVSLSWSTGPSRENEVLPIYNA